MIANAEKQALIEERDSYRTKVVADLQGDFASAGKASTISGFVVVVVVVVPTGSVLLLSTPLTLTLTLSQNGKRHSPNPRGGGTWRLGRGPRIDHAQGFGEPLENGPVSLLLQPKSHYGLKEADVIRSRPAFLASSSFNLCSSSETVPSNGQEPHGGYGHETPVLARQRRLYGYVSQPVTTAYHGLPWLKAYCVLSASVLAARAADRDTFMSRRGIQLDDTQQNVVCIAGHGLRRDKSRPTGDRRSMRAFP
ncbi:hypothetical protein L249_7864 [Ophiocordyceps polyrhachis-furcata BCC 54312]|uniref:Uncharacterized protein n=1 Tax=Ophiocordyceps polyrhachis-furcata BCC 54312 TaxID=1330021 RepID=A0A367L0X4_9HYPO|nr:hypothetical protein L249_7864 [Ophiocordyceps polyrhachis-furcata BCC 54312]